MTVNMFFRIIRDKKIDYQLILNGSQIKCSRRNPTQYWLNEISSINMIQKKFIINITDNIIKDGYVPGEKVRVKYLDLINILNEDVHLFSPVKYAQNPNLYVNFIQINCNGCLEIY